MEKKKRGKMKEEWRRRVVAAAGVNKRRRRRPAKFFKIVFQSTLRVPEKFAKKFGPQLSTVAILKIPTGLTWSVVVLSTSESELRFAGQGWVNFMEHNHIRYGYFLELKYKGHSRFSVHIFDLSCCEIDYPIQFDYSYSAKQKSPLLALYQEDHVILNEVQVEVDGDPRKIQSADKMLGKECNSPCFTITVRSYPIKTTGAYSYLHIPRSFTNKFMEGNLYDFVKLRVDDGREWSVQCYYCTTGFRLTGSGWRKFKLENNWVKGETYTFVLVNNKNNLLVFQVFKK